MRRLPCIWQRHSAVMHPALPLLWKVRPRTAVLEFGDRMTSFCVIHGGAAIMDDRELMLAIGAPVGHALADQPGTDRGTAHLAGLARAAVHREFLLEIAGCAVRRQEIA